jgi:glycosyltransferase involved in cell wall biosynthesis
MSFETYQRVRDAVLRMKTRSAAATGSDRPSAYWNEELENFDYMIDASPLIIRKLRQHAFHITGTRPYDYRNARDQQSHFERRLQALIEIGGRELLVPENPALGGFGFEIDGALHNVDTLKYFEVLAGMKRSGILAPFSQGAERRVVWEIGGGWGGLAYQFKTLWPNTTYVIVDFPELFLYSATYLGSVFPGARLWFWDGEEDASASAADADFVFVPNTAVEALRTGPSDLLVNLVSFQEMTGGQVEAYARLAAEAGCPALYSLNRERSPYNREIASVGEILTRYYDLEEVPVLETEYTRATKKDSVITREEALARAKGAKKAGEVRDPYRHLAGHLQARYASALRPRSETAERPRVGIGVTLFNRAQYLREALDSLLGQSFTALRLVLVDDGSTDDTERICREYAARDARVTYVRNEPRLGMVGAWRRAFELAAGEGDVEYFAWASDHDRWNEHWLRTLAETLGAQPEVVLAYPLTQRLSPEGVPMSKPARYFDTAGLHDLRERWLALSVSRSVAAGDMVYGLMRADAVRKAGVFRDVLAPDRLLMAELTIQGQIRQIPHVLWYRRQFEVGSVARQRHTLFGPGARPRHAVLPTWWQHARVLWRTYASSHSSPLAPTRAAARWLVARYTVAYAVRHHRKTVMHRRFAAAAWWCRCALKKAKHLVLLAVFYTLVYSRRAFWGTVYYLLVGLRRIGVRPAIAWVLGSLTR